MAPDGGLEVDQLTVRYPGRREPALRDVRLQVAAGELLGVAGRTGAGKSTLALASAGFVPRVVRARVEGTVRVAGVAIANALPGQLADRVGIVFSTPANQLSASKLTVREELAFGLENLGLARAEMDPRIDDVLGRLGIAHLASREPFALSGGEQQRVAIASIIVMGTSTLILDEPTAQLDPGGTTAVAELLRTLAGEGRAILIAEHDPVVLAMTDRCVVLEAGAAVVTDRPGQALSTGSLEPIGLRAPTIVRLAERAGIPRLQAFDEDAIVEALRSRARQGRPNEPAVAPRLPTIELELMRNEPAVDIAIERLAHRFPGGIEALAGVDLAVPAGASVAIVGQNGSGKTTLVKHLNGLLRPDAGTVTIGGHTIADVPVNTLARTVGFVFQSPDDQLFNRSVEREVAFGPRNLGLDDATMRRLVDRALELTGLDQLRAVNPYDLDVSLRKLVALASIVAMEPAVLVLDEPTTGQDGPGRGRVGAIVDTFRGAGRTVIAITHDMEFAATHFERIVVMRAGRIVADGPPVQVLGPSSWDVLASTGLIPPVAARVGARLGLGSTPTEASLVQALAGR